MPKKKLKTPPEEAKSSKIKNKIPYTRTTGDSVKVIENFNPEKSTVNMTTNIIITGTAPAEMVGSLIATGGMAQNQIVKKE